jgi:hypothetical protein
MIWLDPGPKAPVRDYIVTFGDDDLIFVTECFGKTANKIKQAIAARRNMGVVLNIFVRPEAFRI